MRDFPRAASIPMRAPRTANLVRPADRNAHRWAISSWEREQLLLNLKQLLLNL